MGGNGFGGALLGPLPGDLGGGAPAQLLQIMRTHPDASKNLWWLTRRRDSLSFATIGGGDGAAGRFFGITRNIWRG